MQYRSSHRNFFQVFLNMLKVHQSCNPLWIPLRGNSVFILFISSEQCRIFSLNFESVISTPVYFKFGTSAHAQIGITYYYILCINFLMWHEVENPFRMLFDKWSWSMISSTWFILLLTLFHVTFSENICWSVNYPVTFHQNYYVQISAL